MREWERLDAADSGVGMADDRAKTSAWKGSNPRDGREKEKAIGSAEATILCQLTLDGASSWTNRWFCVNCRVRLKTRISDRVCKQCGTMHVSSKRLLLPGHRSADDIAVRTNWDLVRQLALRW